MSKLERLMREAELLSFSNHPWGTPVVKLRKVQELIREAYGREAMQTEPGPEYLSDAIAEQRSLIQGLRYDLDILVRQLVENHLDLQGWDLAKLGIPRPDNADGLEELSLLLKAARAVLAEAKEAEAVNEPPGLSSLFDLAEALKHYPDKEKPWTDKPPDDSTT